MPRPPLQAAQRAERGHGVPRPPRSVHDQQFFFSWQRAAAGSSTTVGPRARVLDFPGLADGAAGYPPSLGSLGAARPGPTRGRGRAPAVTAAGPWFGASRPLMVMARKGRVRVVNSLASTWSDSLRQAIGGVALWQTAVRGYGGPNRVGIQLGPIPTPRQPVERRSRTRRRRVQDRRCWTLGGLICGSLVLVGCMPTAWGMPPKGMGRRPGALVLAGIAKKPAAAMRNARGRPAAPGPGAWRNPNDISLPKDFVDPEIRSGALLVVHVLDQSGELLGEAGFEVIVGHPPAPEGQFVEVLWRGASNVATEQSLRKDFENVDKAVLHLCNNGQASCAVKQLANRTVWHVGCWRVLGKEERPPVWFTKAGQEASAEGTPPGAGGGVPVVPPGANQGDGLQGRLSDLRAQLAGDGAAGRRRAVPPVDAAATGDREQQLEEQIASLDKKKQLLERLRVKRTEDALAEKARDQAEADKKQRQLDKLKRRRSRRKRKRRSSSSGSNSSSSDSSPLALFREGRGQSATLQETARAAPGTLLREALKKMRIYMAARAGSSSKPPPEQELEPVVVAYLTAILLPGVSSSISVRNARELQTLAAALDLLLAGSIAQAAGVLIQRFQSVELAVTEGSWSLGKHLELIPEPRVSSMPQKVKEKALRQEKEEAKLRQRETSPGRRRPE